MTINSTLGPNGYEVSIPAPVSGGGLPTLTPYSTTIPLDGNWYMAAVGVTAPVTFTAGATKTPGGCCTITLVADGVNTPTLSGFQKWGGSSSYDNTSGAVNEVTFFVLGTRAYYSIAQASPVEVTTIPATALTLSGPSTGLVGVASTVFTVTANGSLAASVTVTPTDSGGGGTFSPTSLTLSSGTLSGTFTYTAGSTGTKSIGVTNTGGLTNPTAVTLVASATAYVQFATLANMSESAHSGGGYDYTTTTTANQVAKGANLSLAGDGHVECVVQTAGTSASYLVGLDANAAGVTIYSGMDYAIYPANTGYYKAFVGGTNVATPTGSATIVPAVGDKMRLTRSGTTIVMDIIRGATVINLHTVTGVAAGTLSPVLTGVNISGVIQGPVLILGGS